MTTTDDRPRTADELPDPERGWEERAACSGISDPDIFLLGGRASSGYTTRANLRARSFCAACPVVLSCRVDAIRIGDELAIRGAMSLIERRQWVKEQGLTRRRRQHAPGQTSDALTRRVVELRDSGLTWRDVANAAGCSPDAAARRYKRSKEAS